jgi:hypothetical protein
MGELIAALKANWEGYEEMRMLIEKRGKFFGNDDDTSNGVAQSFYLMLYEYLKNKTNLFGYHFLIGDLIGTGWSSFDAVHADIEGATVDECREIERLLHEGVIL